MIWRILQIEVCVMRLIGTIFHIHTLAEAIGFNYNSLFFFQYILNLKTCLPRSVHS